MARSTLIVNVFKWNVKKEELVNGVKAILVVCGNVRKVLVLMRGAVLTLHRWYDF